MFDILIIGHADLIKIDTLEYIKKNYPLVNIPMVFR